MHIFQAKHWIAYAELDEQKNQLHRLFAKSTVFNKKGYKDFFEDCEQIGLPNFRKIWKKPKTYRPNYKIQRKVFWLRACANAKDWL